MVYVLLGSGFEEMEAITPVDLLRRAGIDVLTVAVGRQYVSGSHRIRVKADITLKEMNLTDMDMIVLPGGLGGVMSIMDSKRAMEAIRFAWDNGKYVAAICAAPMILAKLGISDGKHITCFPGMENHMGNVTIHDDVPCVQDGKLITGASAGCAIPFAKKLIEVLKGPKAAEDYTRVIVIR